MPRSHYERLSFSDNCFLVWESPRLPMHTAGTTIYDARPLVLENGGIDFARVKRHVESTLHHMPRYRQKLAWIPRLEHAVWVDDGEFDVDAHIHHLSVPRPGSDAQLKELIARLLATPLDRDRPLWESFVVEGLEGDRFAVVSKTHHCMMDGSAGSGLAELLHSHEPTVESETPPPFRPRPAPEGTLLWRDEMWRRGTLPLQALGRLASFLFDGGDLRKEVGERFDALRELASLQTRGDVPETPISGPSGTRRRVEWWVNPLEDLKAVRRALGCSINDVVLATVAGALRGLLLERGEAPDFEVRCLAPVNIRKEGDEVYGNKVSTWVIELPIDEADPRERLARIQEATQHFKGSNQAVGVETFNALMDWIPLMRPDPTAMSSHTGVTNMVGPPIPLYMLESRLLELLPQPPVVTGMGVIFAVMSYAGRMAWHMTADYDRFPDLPHLRELLAESLAELAAAAGIAPPAEGEAEAQRALPG